MTTRLLRATVLAVACSLSMAVYAQSGASKRIDIPAGDLIASLQALTRQSGAEFVYREDLLSGLRTRGARGTLTAEQALERLLEGSGFMVRRDPSGALMIVKGDAPPAAGRQSGTRSASLQQEERIVGMPAIMVEGARTLNMDITRTRDDPQPYVVFDRELIERSGATSLEQFLQQRLPMNTSIGSVGTGMDLNFDDQPSGSNINLRGLGPNQTLILVDGHRMSSPMVYGRQTQGEISGMPLAAIERIEILPSTASGIYGGSATGGVINIITRKDYSGGEVKFSYDNTFSTDTAIRKIDFVFGQNFNQGRTNLLLSAGYSDSNELVESDRSFAERGLSKIRQNNPASFANYWSMPISSAPNIHSIGGSNLVLKSGVDLGASYTSVPIGYAGVASDGGAALRGNAGNYNWALPGGAMGVRRSLYSEPTVKSGTLVLRHSFNDRLQAFADLSTSETRRTFMGGGRTLEAELPAESPNNPFTVPVYTILAIGGDAPQQSITDRDRAVLGLVQKLPGDWQMSLDYTWDRTTAIYGGGINVEENLSGVVNAGELDVLRDWDMFPLDLNPYSSPWQSGSSRSTMKDATARFSGPLGRLPAGSPVVSIALAHRGESMPDAVHTRTATFHWFYPARSTSVSSAYMEYRLPLFSESNMRPGLRELEIQLAARYENYVSRSATQVSINGEIPSVLPDPNRVQNEFSSIDPTIALRWQPLRDLTLRMSYGTGFLPPSLRELAPIGTEQTGILISATSDPRRGNSNPGLFAYRTVGNPNLQPEQSKSWSAGLILTPAILPGLRLSADYVRIKKTDNIGTIPGGFQGVIDNEALFPDRVERGPNLPGDPAGWAGPITLVDFSPMNLASLEVEALDVQLDYRWETETAGAFDIFAVGTWQPTYAIQLRSDQPMVDYVGVGGSGALGDGRYPLKFKANLGFTWNISAWRAGWNTSYFDSYLASTNATTIANQDNDGRVASQIYHDAFVNYDFDLAGKEAVALLQGVQVQLGIRNLFNHRPPFDAGSWPSYYSQFGSPRLASYYLTLTKRF